MMKIGVYIPREHLQMVKTAMFDAGAGRIGDYEHCCWQCLGDGQFRPLSGSQPFIGDQGRIETLEEYRVEMVCKDDIVREVVAALQKAHPYEEPAYDVMALVDV